MRLPAPQRRFGALGEREREQADIDRALVDTAQQQDGERGELATGPEPDQRAAQGAGRPRAGAGGGREPRPDAAYSSSSCRTRPRRWSRG